MLINNVLISGADDFLAKYLYRAVSRQTWGAAGHADSPRVWMLGTGDMAGIRADIASCPVDLPEPMQVAIHCDGTDVDDGELDESRALALAAGLTGSMRLTPPDVMVYISGATVYGSSPGGRSDEQTKPCPDTVCGRAKLAVEDYLGRWCRDNGVLLYILRPAHVVGTGMQGEMRRLVNRIYRGTYRHVSGNEARVSVVHASQLADIVARLIHLPAGGVYNVTDGTDPTRHDLAEAIAWRLDHKRIYTVSQSKARLLAKIGDYRPVTMFTTARLEHELSTVTYDGRAVLELTGVTPVAVTDYLRNHIYDESSL